MAKEKKTKGTLTSATRDKKTGKKVFKSPTKATSKNTTLKNPKASVSIKLTGKNLKKSVKKVAKSSNTKKKTAKKRKPETLMCFLTTACVNYYSLPDSGYELTTLRNYRNSYLTSNPTRKKLIEHYYKVSPGIVRQIEKDKEKDTVYNYIYSEITSACEAIEQHKLMKAKKIYIALVRTLLKKYSLN